MNEDGKIDKQNINGEIVEPTLENIQKLREITGAKIMACQKALKEGKSFEKAIEYLKNYPIVDKI